MANKKMEFLQNVKLILDKADAVKEAEKFKNLIDNAKIDLDSKDFENKVASIVKKMNKETLSLITVGFNEALKALGKDPIKIEDLIQKPNEQMWEGIGRQVGEYLGQGLQNSINNAILNLDFSKMLSNNGNIEVAVTPVVNKEAIEGQFDKDIKIDITPVIDREEIETDLIKILKDYKKEVNSILSHQQNNDTEGQLKGLATDYTKKILSRFNFSDTFSEGAIEDLLQKIEMDLSIPKTKVKKLLKDVVSINPSTAVPNVDVSSKVADDAEREAKAKQVTAEASRKIAENAEKEKAVKDASANVNKRPSGDTSSGSASSGGGTTVGIDKESLKATLQEVTYNVKIANDDTDKTSNKITLDEGNLKQTLQEVFGNILNPSTEQNDGDTQGPWAKETTLGTVKSILDNIQANITQPKDNWAQVIVEAINTQGGQIVETIKLLLPQNNDNNLDESKIVQSFQKFTTFLSQWSQQESARPKDFFSKLMNGHKIPNDPDIQSALRTLGLISNGGAPTFTMPSTGVRNLGTAISDTMVVSSQRASNIDNAPELMKKLDEAVKLGASVPRILALQEDKIDRHTKAIFSLQTRALGQNVTDMHTDKLNVSSGFLNASLEQIDGLLHTFETLGKVGLYVDTIGDNILFDKQAGFSVVDLNTDDEGGVGTIDPKRMLGQFLKKVGYGSNVSQSEIDNFTKNVKFRATLPPDKRLVNDTTIAKSMAQQAKLQKEPDKQEVNAEAKITPTMEEGAIAKLVQENVEKTPAVVKVTPVIDSAGDSQQAINGESQEAIDAAKAFVDAAKAKQEFVKSNQMVAQSAEESEEAVKQEAKATEQSAAVIDKNIKLTKQKDVFADDGSLLRHEVTGKRKTNNAIVTQTDTTIPTPDGDTTITSIVQDFEKFAKEAKKSEEVVARAQKKLDEFLARFQSKTGGKANLVAGFNELQLFKVDSTNMEDAFNKMTELQKNYANLEASFRKGQSSLNPFVNAINKSENIENIFGGVEAKFNNLVSKSDDLTTNFERLRTLSEDIKMFSDRMNNGEDITPDEFSNFAKQVGEFNALKTQVEGGIKNEGRNKPNRNKYLKDLESLYVEAEQIRARYEISGSQRELEHIKNISLKIAKKKEDIDLTAQEIAMLKKRSKAAYEAQKRESTGAQFDRDAKKRIREEVKNSRDQYRVNRANSAYNAGRNIQDSLGILPEDMDVSGIESVQKLNIALAKMSQLRDVVNKQGHIVTKAEGDQLKEYTLDIQKYSAQVKELMRNYEMFSDENSTSLGATFAGGDEKAQLEEVVQAYEGGKAKITAYDEATRTLTYSVKTGKNEFTTYTAGIRELDGSMRRITGQTKRVEGFMDSLKRKFGEVFKYFSASSLMYKAINELRKGIQYIREIDAALVELRKVTDETEETYDKFLDTASKTASRLGSTISAVTEATATFAKLGYTMEMATEMAEAAIVYKNVGDNIASTEDAANSIISTLKGFGLQASESMRIVDRFNEVGNRFAITSQGLGEALRLSASALNEGGNTLDESIGIITAANEVVNDPSSVGTALKTLTLRLRGSKTELEEMGEDVSDMATTTSQLQAKLLALTGGKVDIMLDANTFKSSTQILREMADAWEDMNDIQRASALELMGGKRQANVLSALIQNFDTAEKAIEASANSAGSALRENEVYLDSIQGRIDLFTNSVQTMWKNALDSDVVKWIVNIGTGLVKIVDTIGLIPSILAAILTYKLAIGAVKFFNVKDLVTYIGLLFTAKDATELQGWALNKLSIKQALLNSEVVKAAIARAGLTTAEAAGLTTTQLLTYGVKGLAQGFKNLWVAMGPVGWAILAIVGAATVFTLIFNAANKTTEELTEELNDLKSNLQDIQSELDSVNSELETTQDRIAELLALPSLSFVEQEELDKLQEEVEMLERKERLLKAQEEREKKLVAQKANDTLNSQLNDMQYEGDFWDSALAGLEGVVAGAVAGATVGSVVPVIGTVAGAIVGGIGGLIGGVGGEHITNRVSTKDKLDEEIESYEGLISKRAGLEDKLATASTEGTGLFGWGKSEYDQTKEELEKVNKEIGETETYVNTKLNEFKNTLEGVEYGYGADEALDKYYNALYKWEIEAGTIGAESDGLAHIFSRPEHEAAKEGIDSYVQLLKDGDESAKAEIEKIISNNDALVADIKAMGLEISDAVDYFTMEGSGFNNTPEGIMAQYQTAKQVLEDLKNQKINLDDLVEYDADTNQATAKVDKIAEHLKGVGPDIQKEFAKIIEDVKEGTLDYEKAFDKLDIYSMQSMVAYAKTQLESANKIAFPDLEISGWLDSVEELSGAFDSLATSMDLVVRAQEQMDSSGRISLKTALDLMASTDEWNKILEVNNGVITMNANAEQILIQSKLDLIKANIDAAIADVETQITLMEGAINSHEAGNTFTEGFTNALVECQGIMVGLKAGWDAFWSGEDVGQAFNNARNATIKKLKPTEQDLTGLYQQKAELEKKKEMLTSVDTTQEFKNNYDFNKTPGDKYGDDPQTKTEDGWEKLISEYENKLALITNERDLIQAEIDRIEAQGGQASKEMYEDLIRSQLEEKKLLEEKKKALEDYLDEHGDSIDPETWTEYNNEINATAVAIKECETNVIDFAKSLHDIDMHYFEQAVDEISRLGEEIEFVMGLFEDEDMFDEGGNWTDAGITKINLLKDLMTTYAATANMWKDRMSDLDSMEVGENGLYKFDEDTKNRIAADFKSMLDSGQIDQETYDEYTKQLEEAWANGGFSKEVWTEWRNEAEDGWRGAVSAGKDAQDQLIEMNNARIDAIEEGINKEIEAYEEYIDVLKESLDAERDLYDFKKNVQKQSKDIASLERRIAALSGSTNAADIAERRKLEAELNEAKEGLNDTYYDHAKDQQSQALDDEANAFSKAKEKYVEDMREAAKDTKSVINDMILNGIFNADVAKQFLDGISEKYGVPLSTELTTPWATAAETAAGLKESVGVPVDNTVTMISDSIIKKLGTDDENNPWNKALSMADKYADFLTVSEFSIDNNDLSTFEGQINSIVSGWNQVKQAANDAYDAQNRKVTVGGNPNTSKEDNGNSDDNSGVGDTTEPQSNIIDTDIERLQAILNQFFGAKLDVDGKYGPATTAAVKAMQAKIGDVQDGLYTATTFTKLKAYLNKQNVSSWFKETGVYIPGALKTRSGGGGGGSKLIKVMKYAKGTTGTSYDQWALTDELGDELVLVPGANGNLSFMRKGTSVVPAEITQNLVEWGKLNPNMLNVGGGANINMISNAINKPEINLDIAEFLHVDKVDRDTMPELEKFVDKKMNDLVRQLNYSIKKFK